MAGQPALKMNAWPGISVPWAMHCGEGEGSAGTDATFGHTQGGQTFAFPVEVFWGDDVQFVRDLLGIFTFDTLTGYLSRELPVTCPLIGFEHLYANRVTGWRPRGLLNPSKLKTSAGTFAQYNEVILTCAFNQPRYLGMFDDATLDHLYPPQTINVTMTANTHSSTTVDNLESTSPLPDGQVVTVTGSGIPGGTTVSSYQSLTALTLSQAATTTLTGTTLTFGMKVRNDWVRYTFPLWNPAVEVLTREGGTWKWSEGGGGLQPTAGTAFNAPIGQGLAKPDLLLTWYQVPIYGLYSVSSLRPENLFLCLNKVNSATFFGCPAGTLKLEGWQITPNEAPYPASVGGGGPGWPSLTADVAMVFKFFDPPHGPTANTAFRGHNLAPNNPSSGSDSLWYQVDSVGDGTGNKIFKSQDFRVIFCYAS